MQRTHLGLALISAAKNTTITEIASQCGVGQSTLSRLISTDRRIDVDTLHALYTRLEHATGTHILFNHLLDEITRAGSSTLDWHIQPKDAVDSDDLTVLESAMHGDGLIEDLPQLVHHLADLVRKHRALKSTRTYPEPTEREQLAAEPEQTPYGAPRELIGRITTDMDRLVTSINDDFTKICGYTLPEVEGKNLKHVLRQEATPEVRARLHAAMEAHQPISEQVLNFRRDGTPYIARLDIEPTATGFEGEVRVVAQPPATLHAVARNALAAAEQQKHKADGAKESGLI